MFGMFGMKFQVVEADKQMRTNCDVPLAWVRPKPPSKKAGRIGTRKAWKRKNPPHMTYTYREPEDILVFKQANIAIVTPRQWELLKRETREIEHRKFMENIY